MIVHVRVPICVCGCVCVCVCARVCVCVRGGLPTCRGCDMVKWVWLDVVFEPFRCFVGIDLETCTSPAGHPSHRVCVKVSVVTSCDVQLWVSIFNLLCSL